MINSLCRACSMSASECSTFIKSNRFNPIRKSSGRNAYCDGILAAILERISVFKSSSSDAQHYDMTKKALFSSELSPICIYILNKLPSMPGSAERQNSTISTTFPIKPLFSIANQLYTTTILMLFNSR